MIKVEIVFVYLLGPDLNVTNVQYTKNAMDRVIELCKNFQPVSANSERYPEVVLAQANSYPVSIAKLLEFIHEIQGKETPLLTLS